MYFLIIMCLYNSIYISFLNKTLVFGKKYYFIMGAVMCLRK